MKPEDLRRIREEAAKDLSVRRGGARVRVLIAMGTSAIAAGSRAVLDVFEREIKTRGVDDVEIVQTGDRGLSCKKPIVEVRVVGEPSVLYGEMNPEKAQRVVAEHIVGGAPVAQYAIETGCD